MNIGIYKNLEDDENFVTQSRTDTGHFCKRGVDEEGLVGRKERSSAIDV